MPSPIFRRPFLLKTALNCWPPYLGAGISIVELAPDFRHMRVQMKKRPYNSNAFGTHFGGSLYAMCDPHYVLLLVPLLGPQYVIWDKAATIEFLKPSRGTVSAVFDWSNDQLADIRSRTESGNKYEPVRTVNVEADTGEVVARVHKTLYVRRKTARPSTSTAPA
jgi:acyl-coenzyme A thioesterase PaaI-like protein